MERMQFIMVKALWASQATQWSSCQHHKKPKDTRPLSEWGHGQIHALARQQDRKNIGMSCVYTCLKHSFPQGALHCTCMHIYDTTSSAQLNLCQPVAGLLQTDLTVSFLNYVKMRLA